MQVKNKKRFLKVVWFFGLAAIALQADTMTVNITQSSDDATEQRSVVDTTSTTLNLASTSNAITTGLRFQNITIPRYATIDSAVLVLTANSNKSGTVTFTVRAEESVNPATYQTTISDISGRNYSAGVSWTAGSWFSGTSYTSQELKSIVQPLVDNGSWQSGNAMAFSIYIGSVNKTNKQKSIDASDAGGRTAQLVITYTPPTSPVSDYRMDECYWLDSGVFDVTDSIGTDNAEAQNGAAVDQGDAVINHSGNLVANGFIQPESAITMNSAWTYSFWMKFPLDPTGHEDFSGSGLGFDYYFATGSLVGTGDLPAFTLNGTSLGWAVYDEAGNIALQDLNDIINTTGWRMVTFVKKSDETTTLYIDDAEIGTIALGTDGDVGYLFASSDNTTGQGISTLVDEVELWNRALSPSEINATYQNEMNGLNYDGSTRSAVTCDTSIAANSWEMIGIPAESRSTTIGVQDVFGDDFNGSAYDTGANGGWVLWKRSYHTTDNLADWVKVDYEANEAIDFDAGYFLGSMTAQSWNTDGLPVVDYNSSYNGTQYCPGDCVEIDLASVSTDGSDGSGIRRYNLSGFTGLSPVNWADCYFIIDGVPMTPEATDAAGYASRTIYVWGGGPGSGTGGQVRQNDYTACSDISPGGCELTPYHGVWIQLFTPTLGTTVKLLIPQE